MIKCVCLVEETENQILLVQVRNRENIISRVVKLMKVKRN